MRECPKCGYVDPAYWRHPPFMPDVDYTHPEDFAIMHPDLAKKLLPKMVLEDPPYIYRRSLPSKKSGRPGWVYRVWKPIWDAFPGLTWKKMRAPKFYDASGRIDKEQFAKVLRAMGKRAQERGSLEKFMREF